MYVCMYYYYYYYVHAVKIHFAVFISAEQGQSVHHNTVFILRCFVLQSELSLLLLLVVVVVVAIKTWDIV